MRIRVVVPITSLSEADLEDRRRRLSKEALPTTEIEFVSVKKGPITIESFYEDELAAIDLLENVKKAEEDGVDAVIIWCSCLLYTSPSPRDLSTSRMPSSA